MKIEILSQPETQLGNEIKTLLESDIEYSRIVFISAFVALRTILRLREKLFHHIDKGTALSIIVGIDLGGTSKEVLEELLKWKCSTYIFHNNNPRTTFHPKIYLFENQLTSSLFVGSNNMTEGGFYTNYEAFSRVDFKFPDDSRKYEKSLRKLAEFTSPVNNHLLPINKDLINVLTSRGELPSEAGARRNTHRNFSATTSNDIGNMPESPFSYTAVSLPPLLASRVRKDDKALVEKQLPHQSSSKAPKDKGVLVWRKVLTKSDALDVNEGSNRVGGVRLVQAKFEYPQGNRIDQTTYFRNLFSDFQWERETGRHRRADQEHTFVPIRVIIKDKDYGTHLFEISHKPSGEAGQNNYTTILRWGTVFNQIIPKLKLTGTTLSLYETEIDNEPFFVNISN